MKKHMGAVVFGLLLSTGAMASNWQYLVDSQEQSNVWIDTSSIRFAGDHAKAWFMVNYVNPQPVPGTYPQKFARSMKQLTLFDCAQGTSGNTQSLYTAMTNGDGEVMASYSVPPLTVQYSDVVPDSVGEAMFNAVCSRRPASSPKKSKSQGPAM